MKLNLGCGAQVVDGWVNVDYALGARFMKIPFFSAFNKKAKLFNLEWDDKIYLHDLTKKFPWADSSVDVVYSSHTLEHLSREEGKKVLSECYRVLRKNGVIRIVVPDLLYDVNEYLEGRTRADDFVEKLGVLYSSKGSVIKKKLSPLFEFPHKCMYDNSRLADVLCEVGFDASPRDAFDSAIDDIRLIELDNRTAHAAIVEGIKL